MLSEQTIIEALKTVYDPEIPVNIYDLGLIYDVKLTDGNVHIVMTLTTATCPAAAFMPEEVRTVVQETTGAQNVHVDVVYEPQWTKDRMSEEARKILG